MEILSTEMDLTSCITSTLHSVGGFAHSKSIYITLHFAPDVQRFIYADARRVRQCLSNLLLCHITYCNSGNIHVTVNMKRTKKQHVLITCEVTHTGQHMEDEQLLVFNQFNSVDTNTQGSGIHMCMLHVYMRE